MSKRVGVWFYAALLMLMVLPCVSVPAAAQVATATLTGLVGDTDKAVIPGAQVTVVNRTNKFTRTVKSNGSGSFTFSSISWGDYDLTVVAPNFEGFTLRGIHLDPGDTRTLQLIQLKLGEVTTNVEVSAQGQNHVDDSGERASVITADELQKLTLQGRDVTELLKTLPGSAISTGNAGNQSAVSNSTYDNSNTQIGGATGGYSMSGAPTNGVSIRSDGANLTDPGTFSGGLQNVNNEATAEVKVEQQNFGADTANGPLVINAVSKSGGTEYHGSVYVNGRTSQLNSTDAFLKRLGYGKPDDRFIYPGLTFGGPIKVPHTDFNHDKKLTFFVQGEDIAQRNTYAYGNVSQAIQTALVPTAAMRRGDFSPAQIAKYLPPGSPICGAFLASNAPCMPPSDPAQQALFTQYQNVHTVPISSYKGDAISCTGVPGDCETPYLDAGAKAQFNLFPLPNTPNGQTTADGYNYSQLNLVPNNLWTAHTKLEYKPNDRQTFSLSYTAEFGNTDVPQANDYYAAGSSGAVNEPGGTMRNIHTHSGAFNWTFNLSATLTNEMFFNLAYNDHYDTPRSPNLLNDAAIGYPYSSAYANNTKQFPTLLDYGYDGLPLGIFPDYSFGPFYSKTLVPGFGDNITKALGKHTFKVGTNIERPSVNNIETNVGGFPTNGGISNYYASPSFALPNDPQMYHSSCFGGSTQDQFCSSATNNALANYLIGNFQGYTQANMNPHLNMREWSSSFYVQDDFKATKQLTLSAGLRFDHLGRWTDQHGIGMPVWRPDLYPTDPIGGATVPLPGFRWHGIDANTPNGGFATRAFFYSPRVGLNYDVYGNGKTTFSGGWGMYRFHEGQSDLQDVLAISNGLRTVNVQNPNFTTAGSKGLRMSYVQSLNTSPSPSNAAATFSPTITGNPTTTTSVFGLQAGDTESPLTETYSATVTQQLPGAMTFSIGYAGNTSHDLLNDGSNQQIYADNVNTIPVGGLFKANPNPQSRYAGVTYTAANIPGLPPEELNDFRPYTHYSTIQVVGHSLYANYNSLQITLNRSKGFLSFGTNYTYSKALGVRGSYFNGVPGDSFNLRNDYGVLSYDRSNIFNAWYDVQLGSRYHGNFLLKGALNGWEISGNTQLQSGPNLQSTNGTTNFQLQGQIAATSTQQAYGLNNLTFLGTDSVQLQPLLTCNPTANLKPHQYINAACFAIPTQGGANGPFNYPYVHGPAYFDTDLSAIKNFKISEARNFQVRLAGFNFINHPLPTFTNKAPTQTQLLFPLAANNNYGQTTFTSGRRTVEIALKYSF